MKAGRRVRVFGSNKDQNGIAPDVVLASAVIDIPRMFLLVAREVKEKRFVPEVKRFGLAEGVISIVYNEQLRSEIPADVQQLVDDRQAEIVAGTFKVPRGNF